MRPGNMKIEFVDGTPARVKRFDAQRNHMVLHPPNVDLPAKVEKRILDMKRRVTALSEQRDALAKKLAKAEKRIAELESVEEHETLGEKIIDRVGDLVEEIFEDKAEDVVEAIEDRFEEMTKAQLGKHLGLSRQQAKKLKKAAMVVLARKR